MTKDRPRATLSDRQARGGVIGGKGYGFQAAYIVSRIPIWLADPDFAAFLQEGAGDVDVRFNHPDGEKRWYVQVKNYLVTPATAREVLAEFRKTDLGSPGTYTRFTLACPGLNDDLRRLRSAVEELRGAKDFYRSGHDEILDNTLAALKELVTSLNLPVDAQFLVDKVHFDTDLAGLTDDASLRRLFVGSLLLLDTAWARATPTGLERAYEKLALLCHRALRETYSREQVEAQIREATESVPPQHSAGHNLPFFPRSLVGREEESQRLQELIHPVPSPAPGKRPWVAVKGMGGMGKTHLVVDYAWIHRKVYETICWVNAAGEDIVAAVAGLAKEPLDLGLSTETSDTEQAAAVKQRLATGGPHLLIFDNVDHPGSFVRFVPGGAPVHVLVTTRRDDLAEVDSTLELGPLSETKALRLMRGEAAWPPEEEQAARELYECFEGLTLLLALAGRLMKGQAWWPSKLLGRVGGQGGPVIWSSSGLPPDHLYQTNPNLLNLFDASLDLLKPADPIDAVARRVLLAGGWLARAPIPPLLFKEMAISQDRPEPDLCLLEDAIARLVNVSLATMELRPAVSLHGLVADYARVKGGSGPRDDALDALAKTVRNLPPNSGTLPTPGLGGLTLAALQPHLVSTLDLLEAPISLARAWIPFRLAESLDAGGRASEAIRTIERAAGIAPDKLWKARFQAFQGRLLADNSRHQEARQVLELAYPVLQSELEPCDVNCVEAGVALAGSLAALDQPDHALALLHALCTECSGPQQWTAACSPARRMAAQLLAAQDRIEDALGQLILAVAIESAIPSLSYKIHEPTADLFVEMFATYALAGDSAAMARVLDCARKNLGIEPNSDVVRAQHQAGFHLMQYERYDEALSYLETAMTGAEQLYDRDDSNCGATHLLLGQTLLHLGRPEEAADHLEQALAVAEAQFEPGDPRLEWAQELLYAARSAGTGAS